MCNLAFILLFIIIGLASFTVTGEDTKHDWSYVLERFNYTTTDENVIDLPMRVRRIEPGVYGLFGKIKLGEDIDNEYTIEIKFFRSPYGNNIYHKTLYHMKKQPLYTFMNNIYKKYVMEEVKQCSDLPMIEDVWDHPFPKGDYTLKGCYLSMKSLPNHLDPGFYKIITDITGPKANVTAELIVRLDPVYQTIT